MGNPRHRDQTEVRNAHACDLSRLSQYQRLASGERQDAGRDVLPRHIGVTDPDGKVLLEGLPDLQLATTEGKGP